MVHVQVFDKTDEVLMERWYKDPDISRQAAIALIEKYIVAEGLNRTTKCLIRASYVDGVE